MTRKQKKAVAVHAVVLVILMFLFLFFTLIVFMKYLNVESGRGSELICSMKRLNYCIEWWKNKFKDRPYNWNEKAKGCMEINFNEPTKEQCEKIVREK